jgi:hypothetical protein
VFQVEFICSTVETARSDPQTLQRFSTSLMDRKLQSKQWNNSLDFFWFRWSLEVLALQHFADGM